MLTQERLKELLDYDPETGVFTWKVYRGGRIKKGENAGWFNDEKYKHIKIDGKQYKAHRLAWLYVYGQLPVKDIDHINRDRADNRIRNLREVSNQQNSWNQRVGKNNTSGYTGVTWYKRINKWGAYIKVNYKRIHLGFYSTPEEANAAYVRAKAEHHKF